MHGTVGWRQKKHPSPSASIKYFLSDLNGGQRLPGRFKEIILVPPVAQSRTLQCSMEGEGGKPQGQQALSAITPNERDY
jgi:hypothetical protein